jgi:hypothetical protein
MIKNDEIVPISASNSAFVRVMFRSMSVASSGCNYGSCLGAA